MYFTTIKNGKKIFRGKTIIHQFKKAADAKSKKIKIIVPILHKVENKNSKKELKTENVTGWQSVMEKECGISR